MNLIAAWFFATSGSIPNANELTSTEYINLTDKRKSEGVIHLGGGDWDNTTAGQFIVFNEFLTGNGSAKMTIAMSTSNNFPIGFDSDDTLEDDTNWDYVVYTNSDTGNYVTREGGGELVDSGIAWAEGDLMRISRAGTTVKAYKSSDDGENWTELHTFTTPSTGILYIKTGWPAHALPPIYGMQGKKDV